MAHIHFSVARAATASRPLLPNGRKPVDLAHRRRCTCPWCLPGPRNRANVPGGESSQRVIQERAAGPARIRSRSCSRVSAHSSIHHVAPAFSNRPIVLRGSWLPARSPLRAMSIGPAPGQICQVAGDGRDFCWAEQFASLLVARHQVGAIPARSTLQRAAPRPPGCGPDRHARPLQRPRQDHEILDLVMPSADGDRLPPARARR
jgi:hypothetical protein